MREQIVNKPAHVITPKTTIVIMLMGILVLASACSKRYEEGPCLSFIKPENRISGLWYIGQYLRDGAADESTAFRDTANVFRFSFYRNPERAFFVSLSDTTGNVLAESLIRSDDRYVYLTFGLIAIEDKINLSAPLFRLIPALSHENEWQIVRLKRKEMWMITSHGGQLHEIRFELLVDYDAT